MYKISIVVFNIIQNSMANREKFGKKLLKHRLNNIQKIFPKKEFFCFQKRNIFFIDPSKIKQLFFLTAPMGSSTFHYGKWFLPRLIVNMYYIFQFSIFEKLISTFFVIFKVEYNLLYFSGWFHTFRACGPGRNQNSFR